ncbi:3'-5' exonuclease [Desulfovibrio inopinatus]|uniref:3'-5' exonuclease n=1 Tax=Desulfovibrio inopinatus TaxID=102109 RepID=UPI000418840C|nr:3'-5' exonuclease [Desulfovibrio inopinatus]
MHWLRQLFSRHPLPELMAKNHNAFRRFDQKRPLDEYEFAIVDTELTGLSVKRDALVSIGAVRIKNLVLHPADAFSCLMKPDRNIPKFSTLIHHITPDDVAQAPRECDVLPAFINYLGDSLIVGHHVGLDMGFLNAACVRLYGVGLKNPCLDTLFLAKVYDEELWGNYYRRFDLSLSYNLADLTKKYGLPEFTPHDSLQDALQTAYLFLFLVKQLRKNWGKGRMTTLKDLYLAGRNWRWYL